MPMLYDDIAHTHEAQQNLPEITPHMSIFSIMKVTMYLQLTLNQTNRLTTSHMMFMVKHLLIVTLGIRKTSAIRCSFKALPLQMKISEIR